MFAVKSTRRMSTKKGTWAKVQKREVPEDGMLICLDECGNVKLFRTQLTNQLRHKCPVCIIWKCN